MIKLAASKIVRFIYRLVCKLVYIFIPTISKIWKFLKLNSRIINQLNKIRHDSHRNQNFTKIISKLLNNNKLLALDVGAQGGFLNGNIFSTIYNNFFESVLVEPIPVEAEKLNKKNYRVISKGLWSSNCKKKLYILGKRSGSSSMFKPSKNGFDLYNFKKNDFSLFDISKEIDIDCTTINESLSDLNITSLEFLKIDTQGSELEILKGLGKYLPLIMKIEVQVVPMYQNVPNWTELTNYLYKMDYITCEWVKIGNHITRSPVEMDMIFIPNYMTEAGKEIILSREKEFISLMLIFGHIKLLQTISMKLNFSINSDLQKLKDKFFY
jgi:FkbM family methyltransferase